jgi:hypothetical protein
MNNIIAPLLAKADIGELIQFVVVLLIFIIPAIGQLLAKVKKIQPPGRGVVKPRPPRQAPADVLDEIGEFLRRAVEQRQGKPRQPEQPAARQPVVRPVEAQPAAVGKISPSPPEQPRPVGGQVAEHVKQHLDAEEFSRRTGQLGAEVAQADRQIDQHLRQVFDHNLSQIAATPGETSQAPTVAEPPELAAIIELPSTFAAGLAAMLSSGESLLQAVALTEIIHRPEERWA